MVELEEAHSSLEAFCRQCQVLYGTYLLSPNMHLHLYLRETTFNFGPVYGYWLFSFERFNGVLKNFSTNQRDGFEATYMKRYHEDAYKGDLLRMLAPVLVQSRADILAELTAATAVTAATAATVSTLPFDLNAFLAAAETDFDIVKGNEPLPPSALSLALKEEVTMKESEYQYLLEYYREVYNNEQLAHYRQAGPSQTIVNNRIQKFSAIDLLGQVYKGSDGTIRRGSFIQALFKTSDDQYTNAYTGQIQYLFVNTATNSFAGHS